jgi:predicted lipoprotein with Yx(FWY)xxD motif
MSTASTPEVKMRLILRIAGAGLLIATAAIHLDLYLTGYRTIPTIGWLFLLQVITGFALGALVLLTPARLNRLVAAAGAVFALSTLGGYLLSVQFGLFGFREVRTTAGIVAGVLEVGAFAALAALAAMPVAAHAGGRGSAARPLVRNRAAGSAFPTLDSARLTGSSGLDSGQQRSAMSWAGRNVPYAGPAVAGISVIALGLLAGALAGAGGGPGGTSGTYSAGATLRTESVGGTAVLANAKGLTLYWFAPDTSTKSACYGSCAQYWPPVAGSAHAGNGITGKFGTIRRTDGSLQETYNGHPLYTYVGDSGPGQANGNNLDLNGGFWHEVVVTR